MSPKKTSEKRARDGRTARGRPATSRGPRTNRGEARPNDVAIEAGGKVRVRRSPEEARDLILGACEALVAERGPDGVGLKDIASLAGVSHALVTHYFGSIGDLVSLTLRRHAERQRAVLIERIALHPEDGPRAWMMLFFEWLSKPATARLFAWALVTGRVDHDEFFSGKLRGARRVADAVTARLTNDGHRNVSKESLDFIMLLLLAAPHGYGIGKSAFWQSLGYGGTNEERDRFFFERLADLVERHLLPELVAPRGRKSAVKKPRPRKAR